MNSFASKNVNDPKETKIKIYSLKENKLSLKERKKKKHHHQQNNSNNKTKMKTKTATNLDSQFLDYWWSYWFSALNSFTAADFQAL